MSLTVTKVRKSGMFRNNGLSHSCLKEKFRGDCYMCRSFDKKKSFTFFRTPCMKTVQHCWPNEKAKKRACRPGGRVLLLQIPWLHLTICTLERDRPTSLTPSVKVKRENKWWVSTVFFYLYRINNNDIVVGEGTGIPDTLIKNAIGRVVFNEELSRVL